MRTIAASDDYGEARRAVEEEARGGARGDSPGEPGERDRQMCNIIIPFVVVVVVVVNEQCAAAAQCFSIKA